MLSTNLSTIASFGATLAAMGYHAINGEILISASIPAVGLGMDLVGILFSNQQIQEIGNAIILGSIVSAPGAFISYGIWALG